MHYHDDHVASFRLVAQVPPNLVDMALIDVTHMQMMDGRLDVMNSDEAAHIDSDSVVRHHSVRPCSFPLLLLHQVRWKENHVRRINALNGRHLQTTQQTI